MGSLRRPAFVALALLTGAACVPARDAYYRDLTRAVQARRFADADARLHKSGRKIYGVRDRLLEPLDAAMLAFAAGDYRRAVAACEAAKSLGEALYTKHVGEHAEAYLFGDDRLPYVGEPFERVAIHLVEALAYVGAGELAESRVEARALQATLRRQVRRDEPRLGGRAEDAFAHLLAGLLVLGDAGNLTRLDDAALELAAAFSAYTHEDGPRFATPPPAALLDALCPLLAGATGSARRTRFGEAAAACASRAPALAEPHSAPLAGSTELAAAPGREWVPNLGVASGTPVGVGPHGRVVVIHLAGEVPAKREAAWETWVGLSPVRVPFALYGPPQVAPGHLWVRVGPEGPWREAELVHNLGAIARATLHAHADAVHDRAVARAVAAAVASDALIVGGALKGGTTGGILELVGLGVGIAGAVTNRADTRCWRTLPDRIELSALVAPAGPLPLEVVVQGAAGGHLLREAVTVEVPAGATRFVVLRTL